GVLVAVDAGARTDEAAAILRSRGGDVSGRDLTAPTGSSTARTGAHETSDTRTMQLREEELDVGKHRVKDGEVNVRREVVTENRTVDVPVTREEVVVERRPAGREASSGPIREDQESMRIPVSHEEVDVHKQTVAREDVSVGKRSIT